MFQGKKLLITGGAGALGREIIRRATENNWGCHITIFSRDTIKHKLIQRDYPQVHSVIGDIRDAVTVYNAMTGKDIVIHAAAVKHIDVSEMNAIDTWEINVQGSENILQAAAMLNTPQVIGISTDKACHPANAYGATKYLMEKEFQEYSRLGLPTRFGLVRYGNVLESTGSVVEAWKRSVARGEPIRITDPAMTRFFISPKQAVQIITDSIEFNIPSGHILIPKMKSLSIGELADLTIGEITQDDWKWESIPVRPGEKMHETLLTLEECQYAEEIALGIYREYFVLRPTVEKMVENPISEPYTSENCLSLTKEELEELLANE